MKEFFDNGLFLKEGWKVDLNIIRSCKRRLLLYKMWNKLYLSINCKVEVMWLLIFSDWFCLFFFFSEK